VFCGRHLLAAKLGPPTSTPAPAARRRSRASWRKCPPAGQVRICCAPIPVSPAKACWPRHLNGVDFVFDLARNARLVDDIYLELAQAEEKAVRTGKLSCRFSHFGCATLESWALRRRIIGKAGWRPRRIQSAFHRDFAVARRDGSAPMP
jgi:hypothetical protein